MRIHRLAMIFCVPALLAASAVTGFGSGCGDSNSSSSGTGGFGGGLRGSGGRGGAGGHAVDAAATDATGTDTLASASEISIQSFTFVPTELVVAAGATVTVRNDDSAPHTATSQASEGAFTPGAVAGVSFDTGTINPGGTATFTIPASAPSGTVIPYYCRIHTSGMRNSPHIMVR